MGDKFIIAIDGPVGVGKGTLAVALAKRFNAVYINTGAMYRSLALACLKSGMEVKDSTGALKILMESSIDLKINSSGDQIVLLNGEEITNELLSPEVNNSVADVSVHSEVRKEMVKRQKEVLDQKNKVIIEGRDIATEVAPDADLKIYLTADLNIRAKRRFNQMIARGIKTDLETVIAETQRRDKIDMGREASPLVIAGDATVIDTSNLSIDETVDKIVEKMRGKGIL